MTKTTLLFFALISMLQHTSAQYTITGRITDEHDSNVPFAIVLLLKSQDSSMVKGAVADEKGNYQLNYKSSGNFIIQSRMVGFGKSYSQTIHLGSELKIHLPDIVLRESTQQLDEIVVKAQKPLYEMEVGKMVVNVSSSITSAGQSVIDVLEKSPGISVNRQNLNLSLNGKTAVVVLMNGRRNRMPMDAMYQLLEGLNANDVEKIEIMSIPPAKYDADGDAGFINIITKSEAGVGTSGSFSANLGYGTGYRGGASIGLSHNSKKIGIYGSYSFNRIHQNHIGEFNRVFQDATGTSTANTYFDRDIVRQVQNFQFGADFYVGERTILSALFSGYENVFTYIDGTSNSLYQYTNATDTLVSVVFSGDNDWKHIMGNVNLQHTFANHHVVNFNIDYLTYSNYYPSEYENSYFDENNQAISIIDRKILKRTPIHFWVGKVDYTFALGEHITWDAGIKGTFSQLDNDVNARDQHNGVWIKNDLFSDQSTLNEDILAAFTQAKLKIGPNTSLRLGLRYEYTTTELSSIKSEYSRNRYYGNIFPSIFYSFKISEEQLLQCSFGRRITRPTFNDMAPYIIFVDPNTLFSGNPNILPTFTNSFNVGYSIKSYSLSLQYSIDENAIYAWQPNVTPEEKVLLFQPKNINTRRNLSLSLTLPIIVTDWWEMQNNFTFIYQQLKGNEDELNVNQNQQLTQLNSTQTFKLPKHYTIEVTGLYNSPTVNAFTSSPSNGSLNIGIQKTFKNDGALQFSCNDILETTLWQATAAFDNGFSMDSWYKQDKRIFTISYSQPIGNRKAKGARKRSVGSEAELKRVKN